MCAISNISFDFLLIEMIAAGLLLFSLFSSVALGRPTAHDVLYVHERRAEVPSGFKYVGTAAAVRDMVSLSDTIAGSGKLINYWGVRCV